MKDIDWTKITDSEEVKGLFVAREHLEKAIHELDDKALVKYELWVIDNL